MFRQAMMGLVLCGTLLVSACGKADTDAVRGESAEADETPVMAIDNESGEVSLILTSSHVFMQLSQDTLDEIKQEFEDQRLEQEESQLAENIKNLVLDKVEELLQNRIEYSIEDINRIKWVDGELVFDVTRASFLSFDDVMVDGDMALETFSEQDALAFIEAFERVKAQR
jgi:hypothetical protein